MRNPLFRFPPLKQFERQIPKQGIEDEKDQQCHGPAESGEGQTESIREKSLDSEEEPEVCEQGDQNNNIDRIIS